MRLGWLESIMVWPALISHLPRAKPCAISKPAKDRGTGPSPNLPSICPDAAKVMHRPGQINQLY